MFHQAAKIANPILRGFNPDPSICRVGETVYIATSTFEWYPGVQIFQSTDLKQWTLAARPLNEARLLDMRGAPDSGGVWAPCLSYADGLFWLCYTNVRRLDPSFKDTPNFVITAADITGPWSDPVYLNSTGFDPSLFHDDDGRKWLVNMVWDHRPDRSPFGGISLQPYDPALKRLTGQPRTIFSGSKLGLTEGPHLYKRDGWYYLVTAEGGTGYDHAITVARSRRIDGPYETDPAGHLLTARNHPEHPLQRTGHGAFATMPDGRIFTTYLCSRPLSPRGPCPLGRETGLQEITFKDGWFRTWDGDPRARQSPFENGRIEAAEHCEYHFIPGELPLDFQWLRTPEPERLFSLADRPGWLRMFGRESIGSLFEQSLVARRQTEHICNAEVTLDFTPCDFQQMAGLTAYYNSQKFHYLFVSHDDALGRHIALMSSGDVPGEVAFPDWAYRQKLPDGPVGLRLEIKGAELQFFYTGANGNWCRFGPVLDMTRLSDQSGTGDAANFTGTFIGMCAQDLTGQGATADFKDFIFTADPT